MKRVLFSIFAIGLGLGLAGCGSSGGVWPTTPVATTANPTTTLLNGSGNSVAGSVFGLTANGASSNGVGAAMTGAVTACPALADFGVKLPSSLGSPLFSAPTAGASIKTSGRLKTNATGMSVTAPATAGDFNTFSFTNNSTVSGVSIGMSYTFSVRFKDVNGTVLALNTSDPTLFWAFANTTATAVDTIEYYGSWNASMSYAGSTQTAACSVKDSSTSTSSAYSFVIVGTFGSAATPCVTTNLTFTGDANHHIYLRSATTWAVSGTFGTQKVASNYASAISGSDTKNGFTSMFRYPLLPSAPTFIFGYGTNSIVYGTTTMLTTCTGDDYMIAVNGQQVFDYKAFIAKYSSTY